MILKIQKEFIIAVNWPVKVVEYENFLNACHRCNKQLDTFNIENSSVGQSFVEQIDELKKVFSSLYKEANTLNLGEKTVYLSVMLVDGYFDFDFSKKLGFLTKEEVRKDKQFMNPPLIFPRFSESTAVKMGLIRRFFVVLKPRDAKKIHPDLGPQYRTPLYYNRALEFQTVKGALLKSVVDIPFDPEDGSAPTVYQYTHPHQGGEPQKKYHSFSLSPLVTAFGFFTEGDKPTPKVTGRDESFIRFFTVSGR